MTDTTESDSDSTDAEDVDAEGSTETTDTRWWLTNDVLAGWLLISFTVLLAVGGTGWLALDAIPWQLLSAYMILVLGAGTWVFGVGLVERWGGG
jgi:hypothetical protein